MYIYVHVVEYFVLFSPPIHLGSQSPTHDLEGGVSQQNSQMGQSGFFKRLIPSRFSKR